MAIEPVEWRPHWPHEKVDETRCRAAIWHGRGQSYQCQRKVEEGEKWCYQHTVKAIERREKRSEKKSEEYFNNIQSVRQRPYFECLNILRSIDTTLMDPDADEFRRRACNLIEKKMREETA